MKENKYYTIRVQEEQEFSEIDFDLYKDIFPDVNEDEDGNGWYQQIGNYDNEGYPIQIDRLLNHLNLLKEKGCNYTSLYYHCDHIGYVIEGLEIKKSSQYEIEEHKSKRYKEQQKKKRNS